MGDDITLITQIRVSLHRFPEHLRALPRAGILLIMLLFVSVFTGNVFSDGSAVFVIAAAVWGTLALIAVVWRPEILGGLWFDAGLIGLFLSTSFVWWAGILWLLPMELGNRPEVGYAVLAGFPLLVGIIALLVVAFRRLSDSGYLGRFFQVLGAVLLVGGIGVGIAFAVANGSSNPSGTSSASPPTTTAATSPPTTAAPPTTTTSSARGTVTWIDGRYRWSETYTVSLAPVLVDMVTPALQAGVNPGHLHTSSNIGRKCQNYVFHKVYPRSGNEYTYTSDPDTWPDFRYEEDIFWMSLIGGECSGPITFFAREE